MSFCKLLISSLLLVISVNLQAKPIKVVTTFTIFADMAQQIAQDKADVVSITKAGAEIHNYQPTPRDIIKTRGADLILWHGMNLELWFEKFYRNIEGIPKVLLTKGITPMSINGGEYQGKPNPHAWMSADNALIYIENITAALSSVAPEHASFFRANANRYSADIIALVKPYKEKIAALPESRRYLVTSEGAFSYLARDLGLKELFIWPINADAQGSPLQMRNVIDQVKKHNIVAVFSESTVSDKPARQVARETGSTYAGVLYVDSLSGANGPVPSYKALLEVTMSTIVAGLQ
ncbi:MAG: metal ABC transporter substrate-binding protein [Pseudomonadales bacterium]|nr:metal ABC transporter substrate-binding protein [Pseudomonadales bacterium]NRA18020.1 metal ABC transporter substrate-binding protein [Oceanospirillaceae bacterium]